ncbi:MAG: hypothetical protein WC379_08825 [Methanoregula sp.]|jgi:hypothetical protein
MKPILITIILVIAVLAAGCTATTPAAAPAEQGTQVPEAAYPGLTGSWTGPMEGYDKGTGYSTYPGIGVTLNITEQHGRIFGGTIIVTANGTENIYGFAGTIGRDGRTLYIAEEDGTYSGEIVGENEIELIYIQPGPEYSVAVDTFRRA